MKKEDKSKKDQAFESLPTELHEIFKRLISEYQYLCILRYGKPFVSYIILADLIKTGWRPTHEPFPTEIEYVKKVKNKI